MQTFRFLIILLVISVGAKAQIFDAHDTSAVERRILAILKKRGKTIRSQHDRLLYDVMKKKADSVLSKFRFLNEIVANSYYGGGKSNESLKNDLLQPSINENASIKSILGEPKFISDEEFLDKLKVVDSSLSLFYRNEVKNKYKNHVISGDDDDDMLVEVEVKVLESFSGKKELAGFKVMCTSPFAKNYSEDFGTTVWAKRKISPGYRIFEIAKGNTFQRKMVRIVYGDPNTYQILFSNAKSESK